MSGGSGPHPPGWPEPRIGDVEREGAAWALGEHFAAGRLSQDEYEERAGRAWQAKTHSELAPLFGDLPQPHGRRVTAPSTPRPAPAPTRGTPQRRRWHPWLLLLLMLFVVGAVVEEPVLIIAIVLGVYFFTKHRRAHHRRHRAPHGRG